MRLMSFAATTRQMYDRTKTVTRRLDSKGTWLRALKPGTLVCAVEKGQGIPKGEKVKRIGVIEIVDVKREPLAIRNPRAGSWMCVGESAQRELTAEGFGLYCSWSRFVEMFCALNKCEPNVDVTRIEFRHRPDLTTCCGAGRVEQWSEGRGRHWRCPECGEVQP